MNAGLYSCVEMTGSDPKGWGALQREKADVFQSLV
jgi:hypothetical protein